MVHLALTKLFHLACHTYVAKIRGSEGTQLDAEKRKEEVLTLVYANVALLEGTPLGIMKAKSG